MFYCLRLLKQLFESANEKLLFPQRIVLIVYLGILLRLGVGHGNVVGHEQGFLGDEQRRRKTIFHHFVQLRFLLFSLILLATQQVLSRRNNAY